MSPRPRPPPRRASPRAEAPDPPRGAPLAAAMNASLLKRWVVGRPMPLAQARHERLSKRVALAVFSSDALSSVAYATEEILLVLILAGMAAAHLAVPVAVAIAGLLAVVAISYQQTIHAYPSGGGSYIVARANLGPTPGLVAAAALLIDYVLTVSVSVAAGVAALTSALPDRKSTRLNSSHSQISYAV